MAVKYVKDFEFPASAGFTKGATDRTNVEVKGYTRNKPSIHDKLVDAGKRMGFAHGGAVKQDPMDNANIQRGRGVASTERDKEFGNQPDVKPGFKKGGKMRYVDGGMVGKAKDAIQKRKGKNADAMDEVMKALGAQHTSTEAKKVQKKASGGVVAAKRGGHKRK